jgi:hypothetical protein
MPDEVFRITAGVTNAERLLIDEVWVDVLRRNRWRRRGWRLLHRVRAFPYLLIPSRNGKRRKEEMLCESPSHFREGPGIRE